MGKNISDIQADISSVIDEGESISLLEPLLISETSKYRQKLADLALELVTKSTGFKRSLPDTIQKTLANLVRGMNCYYSNLIEGHNTHPIEIEQALQGNYSSDVKKRDLQLEAKAHINVQEWIDRCGIKINLFSPNTICEIHAKFYGHLPEDLMWAEDPKTKEKHKIVPGQLRRQNVQVGHHVAVSPGSLPRFLARYQEAYNQIGRLETILALAATHHRLLWIHPFLDGNGRVARLMSHAITQHFLDNVGLWSISRGLARNVNEYKSHLAACDLTRRNDLDGRGNLSEEALVNFTSFFLSICIDQIDFMETLMRPDLLKVRILKWAEEEIQIGNLPKKSSRILDFILYRGEILRGEINEILDVTDRQARRITSALIEKGVIHAATQKAPFELTFPAVLADRWLPGLFPAQ